MSDDPIVNPPPDYTPPDINMAEAIPPEFREKEYFKDKSFGDVIKEHVNLQTLVGQRPKGVPQEDASDEEWGSFLTTLRPKSGDEYELPETDFSKSLEKGRSDEYVKAVKDILFEANVNKRQASKIMSGFEKFLSQAGESTATQETVKEQEFEGMMDKAYTDQKENVITRTKSMMTNLIDPQFKEQAVTALKSLSNPQLFILTHVLDGVHRKYIAEDGTPEGDGPGAEGDVATLQAEAEKIMKSDTYKDFRQPGYEEAKLRVQEIFKKIAAVKK